MSFRGPILIWKRAVAQSREKSAHTGGHLNLLAGTYNFQQRIRVDLVSLRILHNLSEPKIRNEQTFHLFIINKGDEFFRVAACFIIDKDQSSARGERGKYL